MPFSHHSHSGQFCNHATDTLAEILQAVNIKKMSTFGFTEHIPRLNAQLYPGEAEKGYLVDEQWKTFDAYIIEAQKLRAEQNKLNKRYDSKELVGQRCEILIGFETEWIEPKTSTEVVQNIWGRGCFDYFIGSIHHVSGIPIDYDQALYQSALIANGGSEATLFAAYFDEQYDMLKALKPLVVGHIDLIRLYSATPDVDLRTVEDGNGGKVWTRILRNLEFVINYGGLIEINSSALRKGLRQPYPRREVCEAWIGLGGKLLLSDDSHGVSQVATCYPAVKDFIKSIGMKEIAYLTKDGALTVVRMITMEEYEKHPFWHT